MIEAQNLSRHFGAFAAVSEVNFAVNEGEIVGMLGPNGAGKTTTIRMLTGFLPPTGGRVTLAGRDLFGDDVGIRREIGYLPENVALYPELRVDEYLVWRGQLEGMDRVSIQRRLIAVVDRCLLGDVRRQIIGTLSKGYRQRVGLAAAILHDPKVLVLDEPTVGLDPKQIIAIRELIRELGEGHTLLVSTHILPEVELLCRRVMIIDRGRIVAEGTPEALRERWQGALGIQLEFADPAEGQGEALERLGGVEEVVVAAGSPKRFTLTCAPEADPRAELFRLAVERGWTLVELTPTRASLEDVFVRLTTRDSDLGRGGSPEPADAEHREAGVAS